MKNRTKIKQLICDISPIMPLIDEVTEDKKLDEDFGFDSFEFIQLIVSIEEEFKFEFDPEFLDIQFLNEVKTIFEYVDSRCEGNLKVDIEKSELI